jgi:hypothetical protein
VDDIKPTYEEWTKENPIDWDTYDDDEQPAWDFFNHINCNYPLTYRMMK